MAHLVVDDPDRSGVLITGGAGVGKSYLARHLVDEHERAGGAARRVYASTFSGELPLGAVAAGFSPSDAYTGVAPTLTIKRALEAEAGPTMILVDDIDQLDDASAAVLVEVADAGLASLVLTARSGARVPPPIERALVAESIVAIECPDLDEAATAELVRVRLGAEVAPATARTVYEVTCGNPLYVRELLEAARSDGMLRAGPTGTELTGIPGASTRLVDLLERRLRSLSPPERDALRYIAVAGPISHGVLLSFVEPELLESLEERGLVSTVLDGRRLMIGTAHPLHGEILRAIESPLGVRTIRSRVAERVVALGMRRGDDRFRLATWSLDGIVAVAPEVLTEATLMAKTANDFELGPRLASAAVDAEPNVANIRNLAHLQYHAGRWDELRATLDDWHAVVDSDRDRAEFEELRVTGWYWHGADDAPLLELAATLDSWPEGEVRDELGASVASLLITHGRITDAVDLAERLRDLPPGVAAVRVAMTLGHGWRSQGKPLAAARLVTDALDFYRSFGPDVFALSDSVMAGVRIQALADAGEFAEVDRIVAESADRWSDSGDASNVALAKLAHGWSWYLRGEYDRAEQLAAEAETAFATVHHSGMIRWAIILQALAASQRHDPNDAAKLLSLIDSRPDHPARIFDPYLARARGWVAHRKGFPDDARAAFVAGFDAATDGGSVIAALGCAHDLCRIGRADTAAELLAQLDLTELEGRYPQCQQRHIGAAVDGDVDALTDVVDGFVSLGAPHLAAEAATDAARSPAATARDRRRLLQRAAEVSTGDSGGVDQLAAQVGLTRREHDVVALAALGLTSREAADRLSISRRTVETHLGNAYQKLGVNDRLGLLERLRPST